MYCTSVKTKMASENKGIFEWDVIIEIVGAYDCVGVCASENFDYEKICRISGFSSFECW